MVPLFFATTQRTPQATQGGEEETSTTEVRSPPLSSLPPPAATTTRTNGFELIKPSGTESPSLLLFEALDLHLPPLPPLYIQKPREEQLISQAKPDRV